MSLLVSLLASLLHKSKQGGDNFLENTVSDTQWLVEEVCVKQIMASEGVTSELLPTEAGQKRI